jgi:hypothetical protein
MIEINSFTFGKITGMTVWIIVITLAVFILVIIGEVKINRED